MPEPCTSSVDGWLMLLMTKIIKTLEISKWILGQPKVNKVVYFVQGMLLNSCE